jgi:hypothetical protein
MLLAIVQIKLIGDYCLLLTFNNGIVKAVDFTKHWDKLFGSIFLPLHDASFFAQVTLPPDSETIEWPNGADLAAEFLYKIGEPVTLEEPVMMAM